MTWGSARIEPKDENDRVPFDLNTFKYVPISQAAEIPNKLKPEIEAVLVSAGATFAAYKSHSSLLKGITDPLPSIESLELFNFGSVSTSAA